MQPKRIQLSRRKGWKKPEGAIVVSRPSKWGNPYKAPDGVPVTNEMRAKLVGWYRVDLVAGALPYDVEDVQQELRGKALACWCPLDGPCHADVLLKLANEDAQ